MANEIVMAKQVIADFPEDVVSEHSYLSFSVPYVAELAAAKLRPEMNVPIKN